MSKTLVESAGGNSATGAGTSTADGSSYADAKAHAAAIVAALKALYPDAVCALRYEGDPWRLLVMGRLSAQCTDARVNQVSEKLFAAYPTAEAMAAASSKDIEPYIFSCGLYQTKARDLVNASRRLVEVYGGVLPDTMEELLTLPGVGRKIANLLLGDIYPLRSSTPTASASATA